MMPYNANRRQPKAAASRCSERVHSCVQNCGEAEGGECRPTIAYYMKISANVETILCIQASYRENMKTAQNTATQLRAYRMDMLS